MSGGVGLVVGSLHYDIMVTAPRLPARDETLIGSAWAPKFGGKGGNQAVALAKAGVATRFAGAVGTDGFGDMLLATLDGAGIDGRHVVRVAGGSGMSVAIVEAGGDYAAVVVSGANLSIDPAGLRDPALWADVGLLVLQCEVPEAVNFAAAEAARARGVRVVLNAAPARKLAPEFAALIDVLVVNRVEAEMLAGGAVRDLASAGDAAGRLAARFPTVIVTAGGDGLAVTSGGAPVLLPAEPVTVVSTHGAGDAFIGALAAGLLGGAAIEQAAAAANRAAARHVAGLGGSS